MRSQRPNKESKCKAARKSSATGPEHKETRRKKKKSSVSWPFTIDAYGLGFLPSHGDHCIPSKAVLVHDRQ